MNKDKPETTSHKMRPGDRMSWSNTSDKAVGMTFRSQDGASIKFNLMVGHSMEFVNGSTQFEIDLHEGHSDLVGVKIA
jgi:hypothetical protein